MNREGWNRVEPILDRVLRAPKDQRSGLLASATKGDPDLRREVERMLDACSVSKNMLSTPPPLVAREILETPPEPFQELRPGSLVAQYRVLGHIGRGGMGSVYVAEHCDSSFQDMVALKILKRGFASQDAMRRFAEERRILARLEHPNIARILDGGVTQAGIPYFVMELISGDPIDVACDERRLEVPRRLALFRSVCEAVEYAHRCLIVHCDLKPQNILVDRHGTPRLLDFGIARVLDGPRDTPGAQPLPNLLRLTPEYAAPELTTDQLVTARTDVYSLGAILYELLTGERPYEIEDRSMSGIIDAISHGVPQRPSLRVRRAGANPARIAEERSVSVDGLVGLLEAGLDAIVLKALEKEPLLRYGSARELSADVRNYLDGRRLHAAWHMGHRSAFPSQPGPGPVARRSSDPSLTA